MKKDSRMWLVFCGMFMFFILLTGCAAEPELVPSKYGETALNQLEGVSMMTSQKAYDSGTHAVELKIRNDTDNEYFYGVSFAVEQKVEGKWFEVQFKEDTAFIAIAVVLAPHSENRDIIDLGLLSGALNPGLYRVVKEIEGEAETAEFTITKPSGGGGY